jgi:hypothetical protein
MSLANPNYRAMSLKECWDYIIENKVNFWKLPADVRKILARDFITNVGGINIGDTKEFKSIPGLGETVSYEMPDCLKKR